MCMQCALEDELIHMHAKGLVTATLDDEPLSTGQLETMLDTSAFDDVMWEITDAGRRVADEEEV